MDDNHACEVKLEGEATPISVREALVDCFVGAHREAVGLPIDDDKMSEEYCREIVKKSFSETDGDFSHPTKGSIQKAVEHLAKFSEAFRDPKMIEKHKAEIGELIGQLE